MWAFISARTARARVRGCDSINDMNAARGSMPPGPRLPRVLQTAGFLLAGPRFLEACRRRYGNAVSFSTLFDSRRVIMRAVFGYEEGAADDQLRLRLRAMIEPLARPRGILVLTLMTAGRLGVDRTGAKDFEANKKAVDEVLYAEIARRRADPDLDQ